VRSAPPRSATTPRGSSALPGAGTTSANRRRPSSHYGPHRYFFRLYALDAELELGFRAGRRELEQALAGHVLMTAELIGTFER
jgi:phosphatidylethanolamine-binding protein (PEBP) family uncharacterized protein